MTANINIVKYSLFRKVKAPDLIVFEYFIISGVPGSLLITSRFFREKGIPAYGFGPVLIDGPYGEFLEMVHGHNEKISTDNLLFMIKTLWNVVTEFST
ncbi:unnamed protein product [marine sediment metagenome]|uniref:Peptidase M20 dimerisation domain-containing protein n=1 Tax=marine sediment metagenome TaxID=412755 RepID=X0YRL6_9ZZZZ